MQLLPLVALLSVLLPAEAQLQSSSKFQDKYIKQEAENCFNYFWRLTPGPGITRGLIQDKSIHSGMLSIAATGFGLAALPIGVENGWITRSQGQRRALETLQSLEAIAKLPDQVYHGFYYHFIDASTGRQYSNGTEISTIDTALLLAGVIVAGEYFGGDNDTVRNLSTKIYSAVDWNFFRNNKTDMFYMSYHPDEGFSGAWNVYAEQLIMYFLALGSPNVTSRIPESTYYTFRRLVHGYKNVGDYIHSWFNSLFTYQFSHAFIDFRNKVDRQGVNWFNNSVTASRTHYQFAVDNPRRSLTYSSKSWGVTASETSTGYGGAYGVPPAKNDGSAPDFTTSIAPSAAISSMPFTFRISYRALKHYITLGTLDSEYGLVDAYDLDKGWKCQFSVGINKGITLLMLANYQNGLIWKYFMKNPYVAEAVKLILKPEAVLKTYRRRALGTILKPKKKRTKILQTLSRLNSDTATNSINLPGR